MQKLSKNQLIITIVGGLAVLLIGYFVFGIGKGETTNVTQTHFGSGDNIQIKAENAFLEGTKIQISDTQRSLILNALQDFSPHPNEVNISFRSGSELGESLMYQLEGIFIEAGWAIQKVVCSNCNHFEGIGIVIHDESDIPDGAKIARESINIGDFGFPVRYVVDQRLEAREFEIGIGRF